MAVIVFGYSNCSDTCPAALRAVARTFDLLTGEELHRVQGLFVTLDPERDTPEKLEEYAASFHSSFKGLTGEGESLGKVLKNYGVHYYKVDNKYSKTEYAMTHSTYFYIVDTLGALREIHKLQAGPDQLATAIRRHF